MRKRQVPRNGSNHVGIPLFLLRKLHRRRSLTQTGDKRFRFTMQNPLADATLIQPPRFVINGVDYPAAGVDAPVDLGSISPAAPFVFPKGGRFDLNFNGSLLRGANRIHIVAVSEEFGDLEIFVEDKVIQDRCALPGSEEE